MTERVLRTSMRVLLGLLGVIAFGAGAVTALSEFRALRDGSALVPTLLAGVVCVVAAVGGVLLMRGALRGRLTVRRPGHRPPIL